jgi:thiol-disulfide isomerase/thioredoxin
VDGKPVRFVPASGKPAVVVFMCNSCPFAKAFENRLVQLAKDYAKKGVTFYSVNSSSDTIAAESLAEMKTRAADKGFAFAYLKDGDSATARAYGARVTPHVFLVDGKGVVQYRGYVDDSAKAEERTHEGLTEALDSLLAGTSIAKAETKAFGCTIKFAGK